MKLPEQISQSVRRRNPLLYGVERAPSPPPKPVIRQSSKPKFNKTEAAFGAWLRAKYPDAFIVEQDITWRIANGSRFTPDAVAFHPFIGTIDAYEVKPERRRDSRWMTDDSRLKLLVAAKTFPFIRWHLAWKQNGNWVTQQIIP